MNSTLQQATVQAANVPVMERGRIHNMATVPVVGCDRPVAIPAAGLLQAKADRLKISLGKTAGAVVEFGLHLIEEKAKESPGNWGKLFKGHPQAVARPIPIKQNAAGRFMTIARHPVLSNSAHWAELPNSWRTLAELARLDAAVLEKFIASGRIHPELTRQEADYLVEISDPQYALPSRPSNPPSKDDEEAKRWRTEGIYGLETDEANIRRFHTEAATQQQLVFLDQQGRVNILGKPWHSCPVCGIAHHCDQR
jgi:hypothetical protein